jgi:hypothetical protein
MLKTIHELYNVNKIELNKDSTSLEIWFNSVIDKNIKQITLSDVLKMIRQQLFLEIALNKAIEFLKDNPFIGEYYSGELIEHLLKINPILLKNFEKDIKKIYSNIKTNINNISDEEKYEIEQASQKIINLIK